jgi:predicted dehydrogenase
VNFQLRFAPMMLALKDAVEAGFSARSSISMPGWRWRHRGAWAFPQGPAAHRDRHALDPLSRFHPWQLLGESAWRARQDHRPSQPRCGPDAHQRHSRLWRQVRCVLSVNHDHDFGRKFQACEFRISRHEGRRLYQARRQSRLSARRTGRTLDSPERGRRMGRRAAARRMVSRCLRQSHGQPAALCLRRRRRSDRLGRGCLADHGAGRGRLSIQCAAGDADCAERDLP